MIYQNDQQIKGYLDMLLSHHDNNFSFDVILEFVKELNLNNRLIHHLFIIFRKIANKVPKLSGEQYLSIHFIFMHIKPHFCIVIVHKQCGH